MKILICGANGFIGSYITAHFLLNGHQLVCSSRKQMIDLPQQVQILQIDFNTATDKSDWLDKLDGIDAVINCVGVLTASLSQDIEAIHYLAPLALYQACVEKNIKRVIHISALGVETDLPVDYVQTKAKLDLALATLPLNAVILRPSLLYASGAYGGTSFFRALSNLPIIPLIAKGQKRFQPLSMTDFVSFCESQLTSNNKGIINVVGPETLSTKKILTHLRRWFGLTKARWLNIPNPLVEFSAIIGDYISDSPVNSTAYALLMQENTAEKSQYPSYTTPTTMPNALAAMPCSVQDKTHAKLYFVRWFIFLSLFILWSMSGFLPLVFNYSATVGQFTSLGWSKALANVTTITSCLWDIGLAVGMCLSHRQSLIIKLQALTILIYTLIASMMLPSLWLDPVGPLLKNIPILTLTLTYFVLYKER